MLTFAGQIRASLPQAQVIVLIRSCDQHVMSKNRSANSVEEKTQTL